MKLFASCLIISIAAFVAEKCGAQERTPSTPVRDSNDNPKLDAEIVDALNSRYGVHTGFRSNHAKGIVVEGSFTPTPEAAALSRSPLFAGDKLPVSVRFSDASGLPDLRDAATVANPHGMS